MRCRGLVQFLAMFHVFTRAALMDDMGGSGIGEDESEESPLALNFTMIPRLPYARNTTCRIEDVRDVQLQLGEIPNKLIKCLFDVYFSVHHLSSVEVNTVSSLGELKKRLIANKTDLAFPIFHKRDSKLFFKKPYVHLATHPGFDLYMIPEIYRAGQVYLDTLVSSWPLLALSVTLTGMAGIAIWICETLHNQEEFPSSFTRGSWEGFWWAFISMTTVGYGDKCPRSIAGRCFAILWIFAGLIIVSVFTANVVTALTASRSTNTRPEEDLKKVGVLTNGMEEAYAKEKGFGIQLYGRFEDMIKALKNKDVPGILVDRYTMGFYLDENMTDLGLKHIKHYRGNDYSIGVVIANKQLHLNLENCRDTDNEAQTQEETNYDLFTFDDTDLPVENFFYKKSDSSDSKTKSFNIFIDSKEAFEKAFYISGGILAGLLALGIIIEIIITRRPKNKSTEVQELKTDDYQQMLQSIQKGKEMLANLENFLNNMEDNVKKRQSMAGQSSIQTKC